MVRLRLSLFVRDASSRSQFTIHYGEIKTEYELAIKIAGKDLQSTMVRLRHLYVSDYPEEWENLQSTMVRLRREQNE